jgi:hypothetical protein
LIQEASRPVGGSVVSEELELLLQQIGADGPEVVWQELGKADGLLVREDLRSLQLLFNTGS